MITAFLVTCAVASLLLLVWAPWFNYREQAIIQARKDVPADVAAGGQVPCDVCCPGARPELCPSCRLHAEALIAQAFADDPIPFVIVDPGEGA